MYCQVFQTGLPGQKHLNMVCGCSRIKKERGNRIAADKEHISRKLTITIEFFQRYVKLNAVALTGPRTPPHGDGDQKDTILFLHRKRKRSEYSRYYPEDLRPRYKPR